MSADTIKKAIRQMADKDEEVYSIVCNVDSVDTAEKTCDCSPIDGKADLLGVRLMAQNQTGFYIIPKVGSVVVVTMINGFTGYVAMFSEVEEIQLNGDNYDGLVTINELVTKLNNLENGYNDLVLKYNLHTHIATDSVTFAPVTVAPTTSTETTVLVPTVKANIENITVKQGNG